MPKERSHYVCQQCGYNSPTWYGKCPECQAWDSLTEEVVPGSKPEFRGVRAPGPTSRPTRLDQIQESEESRISLPSQEMNRVLGGGLTRGSVALLAGQPGIGKSTLLLQLLGRMGGQKERPLLYVSGEESARQIKLRAERLGIPQSRIHILAETNLAEVLAHLNTLAPEITVIDSVQALYWPELSSIPGSISQVREVSDRLVRFAKQSENTVFLVGHVTKEGGIAGPMALEHLVDTVITFEGDRGHPFRILRAFKNRFGPTDEIGVFDMKESGLEEVRNPSALFLENRPMKTPGTVVFPTVEGSRPLLVEIQGLATKSAYGVPLRNAVGFDKNRLTMLLAVLEKRAALSLGGYDVYVNVVGGVRLGDPAADLGVVSAVVSSYLGKVFPNQTVVFGEVGLAGEIRGVSRSHDRLKEAEKLGFRAAVAPASVGSIPTGIAHEPVRSVSEISKVLT